MQLKERYLYLCKQMLLYSIKTVNNLHLGHFQYELMYVTV